MTDDNSRMDTAQDVVDFVKGDNFFGLFAVALSEDKTENRIFQFQSTDVTLEEAIFRCMVAFFGGVTNTIGPISAGQIIAESIYAVSELREQTANRVLQ